MRSRPLPSMAVAAATTRRGSSKRQELVRYQEANGLPPTLDQLLDLKKEVSVDNADVASCGFLTNTNVEAVLAKAQDSQNQYLFSAYGTELGGSQIAGRRFEFSNYVTSNLTKGSGTDLSAVI